MKHNTAVIEPSVRMRRLAPPEARPRDGATAIGLRRRAFSGLSAGAALPPRKGS